MVDYFEFHISKSSLERSVFILIIVIMLVLSIYSYKKNPAVCPEVKCDEKITKQPAIEEKKPVETKEEPIVKEPLIYFIDIEKMRFAPKDLNVKTGSTLVFRNKEVATAHKLYEVKGLFNGPKMLPGDKFNFTFEKPGNFTIFSITGKDQGTKMTVEVIE